MNKNSEGYADPTAGTALYNIKVQESEEKKNIIGTVERYINNKGYRLVPNIVIKKVLQRYRGK